MNRTGSRIAAAHAVERTAAEMTIRTLATNFIAPLRAMSASISAPESS